MNIPKIIARYASDHADRTAVISKEGSWTFAEVNERSNRLANGLRELGLARGDRVATLIGNGHRFQEIEFALVKLAAARVALNLRHSPEEVIWQINDCRPKAIIMQAEGLAKLGGVLPQLEGVEHFICFGGAQEGVHDYEKMISMGSPGAFETAVGDEDVWTINYTSGTTGAPKGIMIPFRSCMAILRNLLLDMIPHLAATDVYMSLQPLFPAGASFILPCWVKGAAHTIVNKFDETSFPMVEEWGVTMIKTVPTVLQRFIEYGQKNPSSFRKLHTVIYGGAPMPVEKLKEGITRFGPVFVGNYGQTEAPQTDLVLTREDHAYPGKLGSAGKPYTMVEARIVDDDGRDVPVGEEGELVLSGDHLMLGYWNRPAEATAEALRDGWVYTRDVARKDRQGYFYLVDRKGEMIISGGYNIYPNEVEQVVYQHPAVSEAAVIGVPDDQWGEAVKAIVCLKPGAAATEQEIIDFCKERLASYKKPKSVDFVEGLPKSPYGKILRRELRAPYWKGREKRVN
jgi:acyl-CoA synthetase (AMP-forming)/AMP-acid ligase II